MDIRSSLEGLSVDGLKTNSVQADGMKSLLSVSSGTAGDRATLSTAGSTMAQASGEASVRADKVAQVRMALMAGTFAIPAAAVAAKTVSAMLGSGV